MRDGDRITIDAATCEIRRRCERRRAREAARGVEGARAEGDERRPRQIHAAGEVSVGRLRDGLGGAEGRLYDRVSVRAYAGADVEAGLQTRLKRPENRYPARKHRRCNRNTARDVTEAGGAAGDDANRGPEDDVRCPVLVVDHS